eukprot:174922-Prymnesium_polylepis.1
MVKGQANAVGDTVHTQIVASHAHPLIVEAIQHVTRDGSFSPLGTVLIFVLRVVRRHAAARVGGRGPLSQ